MVNATVREGCSDGTNAGAYESARLEKANILVEGRRESLQQHDYYQYPTIAVYIHVPEFLCQEIRRRCGSLRFYLPPYFRTGPCHIED